MAQKSLSENKYFERKNLQTRFCCLDVKLASPNLKANEQIPFEY